MLNNSTDPQGQEEKLEKVNMMGARRGGYSGLKGLSSNLQCFYGWMAGFLPVVLNIR